MISSDDRLNQAIQLHRNGDWGGAERLYREIIVTEPKPAAYHGLGLLEWQVGRVDEALSFITQAIELAPNVPVFRQSLAKLSASQGRHAEAVAHFAEALRLKPDFAEAWNDAGNSLRAIGNIDDAERAYRRALELAPDTIEAYCNLGLLLHEKGAVEEARRCFMRGIELDPNGPELRFNFGRVLEDIGELHEAESAYRAAVGLRPTFAEAWNNLGNVLAKQVGRFEASQAAYRQAVEAKPDYVEAQVNLAKLETAHGRVDAALIRLDNVLHREPPNPEAAALVLQIEQDRCEWSRIERLSEMMVGSLEVGLDESMRSSISPLRLMASPYPTTPEQLYRLARRTLTRVDATHPPLFESRVWPPDDRRIRVGYLSSDFRCHPLGYLIAELLESHDRRRFEIYAYSTVPASNDPMRERSIKAVDRFQEVGHLSDDAIARRIADDRIDLLVDLGGHTSGSRFELLNRRPAPIQATYLGFPGTTGADYIDYILVDEFVVPKTMQPFYSEKLFHLPGSYLVYDSQRQVDQRPMSREDAGLPDDRIVYCAFSQTYKITRPMFEVWMNVLRQVPESVLWLRVDHATAQANLRRSAGQHGIDPARLIFAPLIPAAEHLARYRLADVALDTFPYNQHSMAADTLRMGLPLVTMIGRTMASRVAGSLLHQLGLGDLATESFQAYEQLAVRLGREPSLLAATRKRLDDALQSTDLFDGRAFARKLESAYLSMCYDGHI